MKSFFNKKINLILTIILIALIIYNLFNKPLIEGNTPNIINGNRVNEVHCNEGPKILKVSGSKSSKNEAHTKSLVQGANSCAIITGSNLNAHNTDKFISKIKDGSNALHKKININNN